MSEIGRCSQYFSDLVPEAAPARRPQNSTNEMSAQRIPNLLTTRGNVNRIGRGRARGRGSLLSGATEESREHARRRKDDAVRLTDDDANASRLSAVAIGLLEDPYAGYFGDSTNVPRRMPIINRGE